MGSYQVTGIRLNQQAGTHKDITHIGYLSLGESSRMVITIQEAVKRIGQNPKEFFLIDLRGRAFLQAFTVNEVYPYLATRLFRGKDVLLSLQRC